MGNLLGTSNRVCNQSIVDAKVKYWGDPNFKPTVGPQLGTREIFCVQSTKPPGQAGYTNAGYFGGVGGCGGSSGYTISPGAYQQQRNTTCLGGANCR